MRSTTRTLRPGRYNVYVLSDLPAEFLPPRQQKLLADAVKAGAGFMMLGGRSSFGAGGWAGTPIEDILPAFIHPGDGDLEPPGGLKFVPSNVGLDSYVLQVGATRAETKRIWDALPPILGSNRFGEPKASAQVLATSPAPEAEPMMLSHRYGQEPHHRLRRRYMGLGTFVGRGPARPSQALEADHLLVVAQGERQRQPRQAEP